jgi:hypothetical protein
MPTNDSPRFRISLIQVVASALAAVTAAVAGSYLGVNGTVIGAAVASVLSVAGTAIYSHSLQRTGDRVRSVVPVSARWIPERTAQLPPVSPPNDGTVVTDRTPRPPTSPPVRRVHPVARLAAASVLVFAAALGVLTGIELAAGRPVSDLVSGKAASGTTVFGSQVKNSPSTTPVPAVTVTVTPNVVVTTPTVTQTAPAVTVTNTPTVTPSTSTAPTGSGTPSDSPVP